MGESHDHRREPRSDAVCVGIDLYNQAMTGGVSKTLNNGSTDSDHIPCVLVYESHGQDCRYKPLGDVCSTVSQKYGTGGGNQPIVVKYEDICGKEIL